MRHQVGLAVGRMFHVLSEINEFRRADLDGVAPHSRFPEERFGRRVGWRRPGVAVIGRMPEADERPDPRPVEARFSVVHSIPRPEAIGAVIPHAVMDERPAGIAPGVGRGRRAFVEPDAVGDEVERVVPEDDALTGGDVLGIDPRLRPVGVAVEAFGFSIRPGRIQDVVFGPGRIPGVAIAETAFHAEKADGIESLGAFKRAAFGNLARPGERIKPQDLRLQVGDLRLRLGAWQVSNKQDGGEDCKERLLG